MPLLNVSSRLAPVPDDLLLKPDFTQKPLPPVNGEDIGFIDAAYRAFQAAGDGRSVAGIHFWRQGVGLPSNISDDEALLKSSRGKSILDGISDFIDVRYRLRGLRMLASITPKEEWHASGLLDNARGYEDGWTLAFLRFNLPRLGVKVDVDPQTHDYDAALMNQTLSEARDAGDGIAVGWMHLRMRGIGIQTELGEKDEKLLSGALDAARDRARGGEAEAGLEVLGIHYIIRQLHQQPKAGAGRELPPPK